MYYLTSQMRDERDSEAYESKTLDLFKILVFVR